jgi:hypothetical protein
MARAPASWKPSTADHGDKGSGIILCAGKPLHLAPQEALGSQRRRCLVDASRGSPEAREIAVDEAGVESAGAEFAGAA